MAEMALNHGISGSKLWHKWYFRMSLFSDMTIMTRKDLQKTEEYYYWVGYKEWYPFPEELRAKLLCVYGTEPFPHSWTEQDIHKGSRKMIFNYLEANSN